MKEYWRATLCTKGHILDTGTANSQRFCDSCGSKTISECPHCLMPIRGSEKEIAMIYGDKITYRSANSQLFRKPFYCSNCSEPFPWTLQLFKDISEMLALDAEITEETKIVIRSALPDLIVESARTPLAEVKLKGVLSKIPEAIKDALKNILYSFVSEVIIRRIFTN